MAQEDYIIIDQAGTPFLADLNAQLAAIVSNNSGATEPATKYAYQWWVDTTTGLLKIRNAANSAWVSIGTLASTNLGHATLASPTLTGTPAAPTAAVDTNTTQLATTAYVVAQAASATPIVDAATAVVGTSKRYARGDHVHPQRNIAIATPVATASGSSVSLTTSVPTWARRITLCFSGVSTNGTGGLQIQIGDAGGLEATGYVSTGSAIAASSAASSSSTTGFIIRSSSASSSISGIFTLQLYDFNNFIWCASHSLRELTTTVLVGAGDKTLSAALDRVSIVTTDTFDAGAISVSWE